MAGGANTAGSAANRSDSQQDAAEAQPLKAAHQRFVVEYLKDGNATQAYIRAGYHATPAAASANASRLLRNDRIAAAIAEAQAEALETAKRESGITMERTLREIARIAFFDPRKLFDKDGNPLPITELDDDTVGAVAGLDVLEEWDGSGADRVLRGYVKKWKLADKKAGLDMLMKHLGGYAKDNALDLTVNDKPAPANETARRIAFALHLGLQAKAENESKAAEPAAEPRKTA